MRYFLELSYKGGNFHGWQKQPNVLTIQGEVEDKLSLLFGRKIEITAAGRTDAGVHALQMFVHFDYENLLPSNVVDRLNSFLSPDIVIKSIFQVNASSHARFDAISRSYQYKIIRCKSPFYQDFSYFLKDTLDVDKMNQACQFLMGRQNFKCFSKTHTDVNNFYCDISEAYWKEENDFFIFNINANRFLRNMVRAIVGTMIEVGRGKITSDIRDIIASEQRTRSGYSVPAKGLFLTHINYRYKVKKNSKN